VSITAQTRKLLWGRSGGFCAICRRPLTADPASPDPVVVVGEECHIISEKSDGPRYRLLEDGQVDSYDNLILLCPSDHEIVDKQLNHYTEEKLRQTKVEHEAWVRALPGPPELRVRQVKGQQAPLLHLVETGRDLMAFAGGAHAAEFLSPETDDPQAVDLVADFLQSAQDWGELWPELEIGHRLRAEVDITNSLKQLREDGFVVYGARRRDTISGGVGAPSNWDVAIIGVFRTDDPRVVSQRSAAHAPAEPLTDDQEYWREQIISLAYPLIGRVEFYADFEIDSEIRTEVAQYARKMRGAVKGKFRSLAPALPTDDEEERVLSCGSRAELLELLKTYARLFD
jgi:hypothetical protein